jgi:hypothetical protein
VTRPTLRQLIESGEVERLFTQHGSWQAVARVLGVNERTLRRERGHAMQRHAPHTVTYGTGTWTAGEVSDTSGRLAELQEEWRDFDDFDEEPTQPGIPLPVIPEHHIARGVSTLVDAEGNIKQQWIKTTAQNDERADWLEAIRDMGGELPRVEPTPAPAYCDDDLLAVYPVGDPHVGLLAWHEDAGENFDMDIAERQLVGAFQHLTALAPAAREALLIFIGDNAHADGQSNTTTKGTRVDVDGRTVKMARTQIRIGRRAVDLALTKHERVRLIWERGNHDELIAAMTALAFSIMYENDPRVSVDTSPEMFHWFRFGANLIGTHHGDKVKPMDLLGVMAVDRQEDWGQTKHRRFYLGHYHHQIVKEVPGLICEYLPTLASSDAWHRSMGYRSQRAMYMDVFHRERGHVNRHIVGIDSLRGAA